MIMYQNFVQFYELLKKIFNPIFRLELIICFLVTIFIWKLIYNRWRNVSVGLTVTERNPCFSTPNKPILKPYAVRGSGPQFETSTNYSNKITFICLSDWQLGSLSVHLLDSFPSISTKEQIIKHMWFRDCNLAEVFPEYKSQLKHSLNLTTWN